MAELEQTLRDLPQDPGLAPEPLAAIEARAARRRQHRRWRNGGAAVVATAVVLAVGLTAFVEDRPQVVSSAGTGDERAGPSAPAVPGGVLPTTTAAPNPGDKVEDSPPSTRAAVPTTAGVTPGVTAPAPTPSPSPDPGPVTTVPPPTTVPPAESELALCPLAEVGITTATERSTYAPGEAVRAWSTLQNRSDTACLLSPRAFFRIEDQAGRVVGAFANTADIRPAARTEPGQSISSSITWDQLDCSGAVCVQVPAGTYTAVADWTEGQHVTGTASFQVGA